MERIEIAGDRHLETLRRCGGFYSCPKSPNGERLGFLVGYAGKYDGPDGQKLQYVGDVYANFAKAEIYPNVLSFFARGLSCQIASTVGLNNVDAFCGAPIGGYSLADALGLQNDKIIIKAEKNVITLSTESSREKSQLVFSRHEVVPGMRCVIVEDICNNFSTTHELIRLIMKGGGIVVAIVCFLNRSLTVDNVYFMPIEFKANPLEIPVLAEVRQPINEWRQDDPAVAVDIAKGNVVWKPKDEWPRLMTAMEAAYS